MSQVVQSKTDSAKPIRVKTAKVPTVKEFSSLIEDIRLKDFTEVTKSKNWEGAYNLSINLPLKKMQISFSWNESDKIGYPSIKISLTKNGRVLTAERKNSYPAMLIHDHLMERFRLEKEKHADCLIELPSRLLAMLKDPKNWTKTKEGDLEKIENGHVVCKIKKAKNIKVDEDGHGVRGNHYWTYNTISYDTQLYDQELGQTFSVKLEHNREIESIDEDENINTEDLKPVGNSRFPNQFFVNETTLTAELKFITGDIKKIEFIDGSNTILKALKKLAEKHNFKTPIPNPVQKRGCGGGYGL